MKLIIIPNHLISPLQTPGQVSEVESLFEYGERNWTYYNPANFTTNFPEWPQGSRPRADTCCREGMWWRWNVLVWLPGRKPRTGSNDYGGREYIWWQPCQPRYRFKLCLPFCLVYIICSGKPRRLKQQRFYFLCTKWWMASGNKSIL